MVGRPSPVAGCRLPLVAHGRSPDAGCRLPAARHSLPIACRRPSACSCIPYRRPRMDCAASHRMHRLLHLNTCRPRAHALCALCAACRVASHHMLSHHTHIISSHTIPHHTTPSHHTIPSCSSLARLFVVASLPRHLSNRGCQAGKFTEEFRRGCLAPSIMSAGGAKASLCIRTRRPVGRQPQERSTQHTHTCTRACRPVSGRPDDALRAVPHAATPTPQSPCSTPHPASHMLHVAHCAAQTACCTATTAWCTVHVALRLPRIASHSTCRRSLSVCSAWSVACRAWPVADCLPHAAHGLSPTACRRPLSTCHVPVLADRLLPVAYLCFIARCLSLVACRWLVATHGRMLAACCTWPLPAAHCTSLHTAHCTLRIIHCTLHVVPCTLHIASLAASRRLPAFRRLLLMAGRLSRMVGCVPRMACCLLLAAGRRLIAAYCSWPHPAGRQLLAACSFLMAAGCWSPMAHHPPPTAHHQQPGTGRSPLPTCLWSRTTNGLPHVVCRELAHPSCALVRPSCALAYPSCAVACRIYIAA